jgi:hypothetical protein
MTVSENLTDVSQFSWQDSRFQKNLR